MNYIKKNNRYFVPGVLTRAKAYYEQGRVRNLKTDGNTATAIVEGTEAYDVKVSFDESGQIKSFRCSCPDRYHDVCKHVGAVLYALSAQSRYQVKEGPMDPDDFDEFVSDTLSTSSDFGTCWKTLTDCYLEKRQDWGDHYQTDNMKCMFSALRSLRPSKQDYYLNVISFLDANHFSNSVLKKAVTNLISEISVYGPSTSRDCLPILLSSVKIRHCMDDVLAGGRLRPSVVNDFRIGMLSLPALLMNYYSEGDVLTMIKSVKDGAFYWKSSNLIDPFVSLDKPHILNYFVESNLSLSTNDEECLSVYLSKKDYQKKDLEALKDKVNHQCQFFAPIYYLYLLVMEDNVFTPTQKKEITEQLQKASLIYGFGTQFSLLTGQKVMASEMSQLSLFDYLLLAEPIQQLKNESYLKRISKWFHDEFTNRYHIHALFGIMDAYGEKHPEVMGYLDESLVDDFSSEEKAEYLNILRRHHGLMPQQYTEYMA